MQGLSRHTRHTLRRAHRRRAIELNIVSMIDILTVLVFFLLVNQTGVAILGLNLPSNAATPPVEKHVLIISVRANGMLLTDKVAPIQFFPRHPDGSYDVAGLGNLLGKVKDKVPTETKITILLEPTVAYDTLVQVMDAAREQATPDNRSERELFPDIALGDAPEETHK
jgi:biopolymer transport protein ExbD